MAAQLEAETPGKIWYKKLSIVQQRQVDMGIDALLYARYTAAAQVFDTMVHQQETDNDDVHNDDDNEIID
jgi:hypothetical protein